VFEHTANRCCWNLAAPRISHELSTVYLRGTGGIELDRNLELVAGQPFDDEHGAGADRTAQLSSDLRIAFAGRLAE
jgi:hypothetical protein